MCKRMRICVVLREVVFVAFLTAQMQVKGMFECMGMGRASLFRLNYILSSLLGYTGVLFAYVLIYVATHLID